MPELNGARAPGWLHQLRQQIQSLDIELHALLGILIDSEKNPDYLTASVDAVITRGKIMARVISYVIALREQKLFDTSPGREAVNFLSRPGLSFRPGGPGASHIGDRRPGASRPKPSAKLKRRGRIAVNRYAGMNFRILPRSMLQ
ncbi:MAG: hypothetical protein JO189_28840 [Deltaproteobacteria bacterium]|nr:hypothetical protein [Deltaproteobacteria bacterium]